MAIGSSALSAGPPGWKVIARPYPRNRTQAEQPIENGEEQLARELDEDPRTTDQVRKEIILNLYREFRREYDLAESRIARGRIVLSHGGPLAGALIPHSRSFVYWRGRNAAGAVKGGFVRALRPVARRVFMAGNGFNRWVIRQLRIDRIRAAIGSLREFKPYLEILRTRIDQEHALKIYWSSPEVKEIFEKARESSADLWVANGWMALPIVARLVEEKGGRYIYDSHEPATWDRDANSLWSNATSVIAEIIERKYISGAGYRFSASSSHSAALTSVFNLEPPCDVIRNLPWRDDPVFRRTGVRIRVLYNGSIAANRGLEAAIQSVSSWRPEFSLTIFGRGNPEYVAQLRRLVDSSGSAHRIDIVPTAASPNLVCVTTEFDVGLLALPDHGAGHHDDALPDAFLEYVNSGLAVCVTHSPELASLVQSLELGVLLPDPRPEKIAAVINGLDRMAIDRYKRNSIRASEALCWQSERRKLIEACHTAVAASGQGA